MAGCITQPVPGSGHFQQARHPLEVVNRRFDYQAKLGSRQTNAPDYLAAHLREAGKDMFDAGSGAGYALVLCLAPLPYRLASLALALDMRSPADHPEPLLSGLIVIAAIRPEVPAAVVPVEHIHQMPCIGLAGIAHPHAANELVPAIHADRELVAEIRLAVLLRPARLDILLPPFGGRPFDRYRLLLHHRLLIGRVVLNGCANDAGVDDLPLAGPESMLLQLALHLGKDLMLDVGLYQALAKDPDRVAIRNSTGVLQPGKTLEAHAVDQLELHLLIGQVEQLLEHQKAGHQLRWIGRPTALGPTGPGRPAVDLGCQGRKVHMLVQQGQWIAQAVQLGFTFLVGKQTEHGQSSGGSRARRFYREVAGF